MDAQLRQDLAEYQAAPQALVAAVAGLSEQEVLYSPAPGKWCIQELVVHLADAELVGAERLRKIAGEERPTLIAYDQDHWAANLSYRQRHLGLALDMFRVLRESNADLLSKLPDAVWERIGIHQERGPVTLRQVFDIYVRHGKSHLEQIRRIRAGLGK